MIPMTDCAALKFKIPTVTYCFSAGPAKIIEEYAMATIRDGNKTVLLVVDVQVGVVKEAWEAPRVIANVARAVERARAADVPVIWVQHSDEELVKGSPEWQWIP